MASFENWSDEMLDAAEELIIFFRTHLDIAVEVMFAPFKFKPVQKVIARAIGNADDVKIACSRGFGKTIEGAMCAAAIAVLYPGADQISTSNVLIQATLLLEKIKMVAEQNPNLANEIKPISSKNLVSVTKQDARCLFKSGSKITAIALESARGQRAKVLWQDESLDVNQDEYNAIAEPIKNTTRYNPSTYGFKDFSSKTICLTSACDKGNSFYAQYIQTLTNMARGDTDCFACALDYMAAVENGITDIEFFEKEKKRLPDVTFQMEYGTIFVGGASNSAFPYEIIDPCRTLKKIELEQPKNSKSRYVIAADIATSDAKGSDNTILSVLKFIEKSDGSFAKKVVFIRSFNGKKLDFIVDEMRKLYHLKFPNAEKLIFDARGLGDGIPVLFDKEWIDLTTGKEYPPLVCDDVPQTNSQAMQILHPVRAVQSLNQRIYTNMRVALEQKTIELPITYRAIQQLDAEQEDPNKKLTMQEKSVYLEADALQHEMGNIVAKIGASGNVLYDVPKAGQHKDRYSSVSYANDYISEIEKENIKKFKHGDVCVGICDAL